MQSEKIMKRGLLLKFKTTIVLAALVMNLGVSATAFASETTDQINSTQKALTADQKTLADLQQQIKDIDQQTADLAKQKQETENAAEEAAEKLNNLKEELQTITLEETEAQSTMASDMYSVSPQSSANNYSQRVLTAFRKLNDLTEQKEKLTAEKSDVHTSLATLQGKIETFADQAAELQAKKAELTEKVKDTDAAIKKENTAIEKLKKTEKTEKAKAEAEKKTAKTGFASPLATKLSVSSGFGGRQDPTGYSGTQHDGIDLPGAYGQKVMAARDGVVEMAGTDPSAGNYVIIKHDNGYYSYYMHLSKISVSKGQKLNVGQTVGLMGSTGNSTGVHLHFGLSKAVWSGFVDPSSFLGL